MLAACGGEAAVIPQTGGEPTIDHQDGGEAAIYPQEIGDPEWGREIFETGGGIYPKDGHLCIKCYSLDGSEGKYGPSMKGISEGAGERVPELSAVEYLRQSIL